LTIPAVAALAGVCVVHMLDGPGSLSDHFYVGALELALAVACAPLAVMLLMRPTRSIWTSALVLNLTAMALFVLSRTTGLPGSADDIGHWSQTLGVVNLLIEATLIGLAACAMRPRRRR
jgi:hypothetical protein